jgi:hypothetical protein
VLYNTQSEEFAESFSDLTSEASTVTQLRQYSICDIQDEILALVSRGVVGRQSRIYDLSRYFGDREWPQVERLFEGHDYLLRDFVADLISKESWCDD